MSRSPMPLDTRAVRYDGSSRRTRIYTWSSLAAVLAVAIQLTTPS